MTACQRPTATLHRADCCYYVINSFLYNGIMYSFKVREMTASNMGWFVLWDTSDFLHDAYVAEGITILVRNKTCTCITHLAGFAYFGSCITQPQALLHHPRANTLKHLESANCVLIYILYKNYSCNKIFVNFCLVVLCPGAYIRIYVVKYFRHEPKFFTNENMANYGMGKLCLM